MWCLWIRKSVTLLLWWHSTWFCCHSNTFMALPEFLIFSVHLVALLQLRSFLLNHLKLTFLVKKIQTFMQFTLSKDSMNCCHFVQYSYTKCTSQSKTPLDLWLVFCLQLCFALLPNRLFHLNYVKLRQFDKKNKFANNSHDCRNAALVICTHYIFISFSHHLQKICLLVRGQKCYTAFTNSLCSNIFFSSTLHAVILTQFTW